MEKGRVVNLIERPAILTGRKVILIGGNKLRRLGLLVPEVGLEPTRGVNLARF